MLKPIITDSSKAIGGHLNYGMSKIRDLGKLLAVRIIAIAASILLWNPLLAVNPIVSIGCCGHCNFSGLPYFKLKNLTIALRCVSIEF